MVKMRPAITLFITLAIVAAMLALVGLTFGYLSKARSKAQDKAALIEADLIYADVSDAVNKFIGKNPTTGVLKNIYSLPIVIKEKKGPFNLLAACAPLQAAVPITWLKENSNTKEGNQREYIASVVFDNIALNYRLKDPQRLKGLIAKALSSGRVFKFGVESRLKRKKDYLSYSEFKGILNQYALTNNDLNVYKVDWKSYFSFGEDYGQIDGNFLSSKLISIIFGIDEQIVQEDFKSGNLRGFLIKNGADMTLFNSKLFAKKPVVAMSCRATYTFGKGNYSLKLKYINGKVEGFEFIK